MKTKLSTNRTPSEQPPASAPLRALLAAAFCALAASAHAATFILPVEIAAREGDPVPGIAGATFDQFGPVAANPDGKLAFRALIAGMGVDSTNNQVLVVGPAGDFQIVLRTGEPGIADTNEVIQSISNSPLISNSGIVTFSHQESGTTGHFLSHAGGPLPEDTVVISWGPESQVEGTPFIATNAGIGAPGSQIVSVGGNFVAFAAPIQNPGAPGAGNVALYKADAVTGEASLVTKTGDPSPGGTFAPPNVFTPVFDHLSVSGADGSVIFIGQDAGGEHILFFNGALPPGGYSELPPIASSGDQPPGARPGRGFDGFGTVNSFGGSDVIFDSSFNLRSNGAPTPSFEAGCFSGKVGAKPNKPASPSLLALRDRPAAGTSNGIVYSFFPQVAAGPRGTFAFAAELFKRPNGITPPADRAVFAGFGGKKPKRLFTGGATIPGAPDGLTVDGPDFFGGAPVIAVDPAGVGIYTSVKLSNGDDAVVISALNSKGKVENNVIIHDGMTVNDGTGEHTLTSFTPPLAPFYDGRFATNAQINGGDDAILIADPPKDPAPVYQPDLICRTPGTGGDNVYENKAKVQKYKTATNYNMVTDYPIVLENDGNVTDTIKLTGDRDSRFFKWFISGAPIVEITTDVLSKNGRSFTLPAGGRVELILRTERQTLEVAPKTKTAKHTFKAISTGDKKKVDQQTIEVTYSKP